MRNYNHSARIFVIFMLLALVLAGCRESQQSDDTENTGATITVSYDPNPPAVGDATLMISLTDADGDPINDATVNVRGDMNHAGMAPVDGEADGGIEGIYTVPFEWTMGGDWILTITATLADGSTISEEVEINGVSSDGDSSMDDMDMGEMEMTEEAESANDG